MSLKLGHKIFLLVAIPLLFILLVIAMFAFVQRSTKSAAAVADHSDAVLAQSDKVWGAILSAEDDQRSYILTQDPLYLERFQAASSNNPLLVEHLEQLVGDNKGQESRARSIGAEAILLFQGLAQSIDVAHPRLPIQQQTVTLRTGSHILDTIGVQVTNFNNEELRLQTERDATLNQLLDRFNKLLAICALAAFLSSLVVMQIFSRVLVRRLKELGREGKRIVLGGTINRAPILGGDEIAQLHRSFREMADILEKRQTMLARYELMVRSARDVILFVSCDDLRIVDANDAAIRSYGYDRETLLGMTIPELRMQDTRAVHDYELLRADGDSKLFETIHHRKDGSTFPVEVAGSAAEMEGKRVLLTVVRDVTDRKRAEREHERLFARSNDLMGVANLEGCFTSINAAWEIALGYSIDELIGRPFLEFVHPEDRPSTVSALETLNLGQAVSSLENRFVRKDGSYVWLSWSAIPSLEEGLVYAVARDVTKRKEIEAELALSRDQAMEASFLKSQFLANMSHEIRTPMNGIVATSELLLRSKLSGDEREYAGIIGESARALLTIINQILDLSKLEASKLELESAQFTPLIVAENVTELLKFQAAQKKIALHTFVTDDVPQVVCGDAGRLRQILINLLGNALKFTEKGAVKLRVSLQSEDVQHVTLRFAVSDTGIGLSTLARERIFEPFTQADGSNSRRYDGSGLGLSISKRLVELMDGKIDVESEPGVGSTFWFTARFATVGGVAEVISNPPLRGRRLLIVDSDATSRDVIAQYARSWGVRSAATADTDGVMQMLREGIDGGDPFHFVILDLKTADAEAWRISELIANDEKLSATKLILATTLDVRESMQASHNVAGYLSKPVRQSQLHDCMVTATHVTPAKSTVLEGPLDAAPRLELHKGGHSKPRSARILLAEDHAINRRIALAQLKELGWDADVATNGQEAIDAYERHHYDVILMDCQMPEADGFAATRAIRAIQARDGTKVRIIAMTANAMEGDRKACIEAGMDDYLSKPVELETMRITLLPLELTEISSHRQGGISPIVWGGLEALDHGRLLEVFGDDALEIGEVLELTILECRPLVAAIQLAAAQEDVASTTQLAHKFKAVCGNVGAKELAVIGLYIERTVKSADWAAARGGCSELDAALTRFVAAASATRAGADEAPLREAL